MTQIVLFHHALGLTEGVVAFADRLRAAGHSVLTPDVFEGAQFDSVEAGVAHASSVGFEEIMNRGVAAGEQIDGPLVVIGFSLGAMPAQKLAQTRPGVLGAVLFHSAIPISEFGESWPTDLGVQVHLCEHDPWALEDLEAARELAATPRGDLFLYDSAAHLVADHTSADYDAKIADVMIERTLDFVDGL